MIGWCQHHSSLRCFVFLLQSTTSKISITQQSCFSATDMAAREFHTSVQLHKVDQEHTEAVALESPLDCKEIQPVHPKRNKSRIFFERTDGEAETPIFWPPDAKSWLIWKDPDAWKDWRWEEKGTTEDEMVGWHHRLNGHEFEETLGVGDGQGGLECCHPWGRKELDTTERLNWTGSLFLFCRHFRVII